MEGQEAGVEGLLLPVLCCPSERGLDTDMAGKRSSSEVSGDKGLGAGALGSGAAARLAAKPGCASTCCCCCCCCCCSHCSRCCFSCSLLSCCSKGLGWPSKLWLRPAVAGSGCASAVAAVVTAACGSAPPRSGCREGRGLVGRLRY